MLQAGVIELGDFVDVFERLLGLVRDLFFGQLFVVEYDDFLDRAAALAQVVADGDEFLDDDRRTSDGLHHDELAALDALGDGDFAFAREQRNGAHFAQVHANGIVGFFERAGSQVKFALALVTVAFFGAFAFAGIGGHFDGARRFRGRLVLVNFDTVAFKRGEKVVDFFRGMHFRRKGIVYFVVQQVAALFANGDELALLLRIFLQEEPTTPQILPQSDNNPAHSYHTGCEPANESFILPRHEQADV